MTSVGAVATIASLIAEPARSAMLVALMDERWLTAGELCKAAGVSAPTGSSHLRQLLDGRLLKVWSRGRHRYFQLSGPDVANAVEQLMSLSVRLDTLPGRPRPRTGPSDPALRFARVCYDHLAGELAVAIAERMTSRGALVMDDEGAAVTKRGLLLFAEIGVHVGPSGGSGFQFCQPCLDWSVRRPHLGGAVGRSMLKAFVERQWLRRDPTSRALAVTRSGQQGLEAAFGPLPHRAGQWAASASEDSTVWPA